MLRVSFYPSMNCSRKHTVERILTKIERIYGLDCQKQFVLSLPSSPKNYALALRWRLPVLWVAFLREDFKPPSGLPSPAKKKSSLPLIFSKDAGKVNP